MSNGVSLQVDQSLVKPIIEAKIQEAIVSALGGNDELVSAIVTEVVERRQRRDDYSGKSWTLLEKLCHETLTKAIEAALREWAESNRAAIQAEVLKQLKSKKGTATIVTQMLSGLASMTSSAWRFQVIVNDR